VLVQFVAENRADNELVGLATCFGANLREKFAHIAFVSEPRFFRTGIVLDPVTILLNYVFTLWDLRKIYMESVHYNYLNIKSGEGRYFVEEGRLREHQYYGGRYWDLHILALYREVWEENKARALRLALPRSASTR
jgi:RimJ/RimL family protein N-acetyltransferase